MRAVIVVESLFGNTRAVADEIAAGIGDAEVLDIRDAPASLNGDDRLLVLGGPTHAFGMSRTNTRADAVRQGGADPGIGIRDFLGRLEAHQDLQVAVFDTRVEKVRRLPGSAARGAAKLIRHLDYPLAAEPESFYVSGTTGPLVEGERERARSWGQQLAELIGSPTHP